MWRVLTSLIVALPGSGLVAAQPVDDTDMRSPHYQLFHASPAMPPPGRWDKTNDSLVIDLLSFKGRLDTAPEPVRRYLAQLTGDFTRSVWLRNALKRDDVVTFSDYWTTPGSLLTIVDYRKNATAADLTPYLGPLSALTTSTYGPARFHFHYKGEVLPFWGIAEKDSWSLRQRYWVNAQVFLPFGESADRDIAVIGMALGHNRVAPVGTFILLPRKDAR